LLYFVRDKKVVGVFVPFFVRRFNNQRFVPGRTARPVFFVPGASVTGPRSFCRSSTCLRRPSVWLPNVFGERAIGRRSRAWIVARSRWIERVERLARLGIGLCQAERPNLAGTCLVMAIIFHHPATYQSFCHHAGARSG
jgi:hypothetical protein